MYGTYFHLLQRSSYDPPAVRIRVKIKRLWTILPSRSWKEPYNFDGAGAEAAMSYGSSSVGRF
jgi:hypothetical protein